MQSRENIQELNDHLQAFPKAEDIFTEDQQWLRKHFLPLADASLQLVPPSSYLSNNSNYYHK